AKLFTHHREQDVCERQAEDAKNGNSQILLGVDYGEQTSEIFHFTSISVSFWFEQVFSCHVVAGRAQVGADMQVDHIVSDGWLEVCDASHMCLAMKVGR
ncbi:MAG: hypothetical protein WA383_10595, partial [Terriglobales bacterium]